MATRNKKAAVGAESEQKEVTFTKQQLIRSQRYISRIDVLNAILKENKKYTIKEVDAAIKDFMKGKVNE